MGRTQAKLVYVVEALSARDHLNVAQLVRSAITAVQCYVDVVGCHPAGSLPKSSYGADPGGQSRTAVQGRS
jgi:hypothetical protein